MSSKTKAGGKKLPNAAVAALKERLAKQKELELQQQREADQRAELERELEQQRIEREKQAELERAERAREKKLEKERLRREGKLLTPSEQAAQLRKQQFLDSMVAQGMVIPDKSSHNNIQNSESTDGLSDSVGSLSINDSTPSHNNNRMKHNKSRKPIIHKKTDAQLLAEKIRADEQSQYEQHNKHLHESIKQLQSTIDELLNIQFDDIIDIDEQPPYELLHTDVEDENGDSDVLDSWDDADNNDSDTVNDRQARHDTRLIKLGEWKKQSAIRAKQRMSIKKQNNEDTIKQKKLELDKLTEQYNTALQQQAEQAEKRKSDEFVQQQLSATTDKSHSDIIDVDTSKGGSRKKSRDMRSPICCILGHVDTGMYYYMFIHDTYIISNHTNIITYTTIQ